MKPEEWVESYFNKVDDFIPLKKLHADYCMSTYTNMTYRTFKKKIINSKFNNSIVGIIEKLHGNKFYPIMIKLTPID